MQGTEIKGEILSGPEGVPRKIVFLEGYRPETAGRYRGLLPSDREQWVCALVRDTQPGARKGALIVNPLRRAVWLWREVGEEVFGVRRQQAFCPEFPGASEYLAPFSHTEVEAQNASFRVAEARQRVWDNGGITTVIKEFGPVTALEHMDDRNFVAVVLPHGRKVVWKDDLKNYLPNSPTGKWRVVEQKIEAEYAFDTLPSATVWDRVASIDPSSPSFYGPRLSAETREEILSAVKAIVPTPEAAAEAQWRALLVDAGGMSAGLRIKGLRKELRDLRMPGEMVVVDRSYTGQIHYAASDDEYRPAGSYEGTITEFRLLVGARRMETSDWRGSSLIGGTEFHLIRKEGEPETLRQELIESRKKELAEALTGYASAPEPELSGLSREEWKARFMTVWTALRAAAESSWKQEDDATVAAAHEEWARYDVCVIELQALRLETDKISAKCRKMGAHVEEGYPSPMSIGTASIEELAEEITAHRAWLVAVERAIEDARLAREAREREEAARCEAARIEKERVDAIRLERSLVPHDQRPTEWVAEELSEGMRELAETLARRSFEVCGRGAEEFISSVAEASYGRAGRQHDLRERLGESGIEGVLSFGKAASLNAVLDYALRLVRDRKVASTAQETPANVAAPKQPPVEAIRAPAQAVTATLDALKGKFSKKR